jgi:uncharacterized RDD family membrane protein YckC
VRRARVSVLSEVPSSGRPRPVTTPEGIELPFVLASAGQRLSAFLLDLTAILGGLVLLLGVGLLAGGRAGWFTAFLILAAFFLWNAWFLFFELRRGATPGKRRIGIRVMDARGGPLAAEAIVARNVMRNLEMYVPIVFLFASDQIIPGLPVWARVASGAWVVVFLVLPLLNRDRLRAGDLVAGTVVVVAPQTLLLPDLATDAARKPGVPTIVFSDAQLAVYGVYELQVLEEVLRRDPHGMEAAQAVDAVAERIARKIGHPNVPRGKEARAFLMDFYAAQRTRLEQRMLFGRRKKDKFDS